MSSRVGGACGQRQDRQTDRRQDEQSFPNNECIIINIIDMIHAEQTDLGEGRRQEAVHGVSGRVSGRGLPGGGAQVALGTGSEWGETGRQEGREEEKLWVVLRGEER